MLTSSARHIYSVLTSQRFNDWYNTGKFDAHIQGDENCQSLCEICQEITRMFTANDGPAFTENELAQARKDLTAMHGDLAWNLEECITQARYSRQVMLEHLR